MASVIKFKRHRLKSVTNGSKGNCFNQYVAGISILKLYLQGEHLGNGHVGILFHFLKLQPTKQKSF